MLFGDKKIFAINANVIKGDEYLFISYCFFVDNKKVGDDNLVSLLNLEISNFEYNLKSKDKRNITNLKECNHKDIYDYLKFKIWGIGSFVDIRINERINFNFELLSVIQDYGVCFDSFFCFLLEFIEYDLFISNDINNNIISKKIPKDMFYETFEQANEWIMAQNSGNGTD